MPEMAPDDALALAVHQHEEGAFEGLVRRFEKPLFNYVERLLRHVPDSQEVVQDAFLRAHRALTQQYDRRRCSELQLRPWLFRIARNLARNKRRGLRHTLETTVRDPSAAAVDPPGEAISVLSRLEQREEIERLQGALERLPADSRELIVLRFIEEMSYGDIATVTGRRGEAALRGRVFRALRQLRDELTPKENPHAL